MSRSKRVFWVAAIFLGASAAAWPFRKPVVTVPSTSPSHGNRIEWRSQDVPLSVPSTGVSPAVGLYDDASSQEAWEEPESPRSVVTTPRIFRPEGGLPSPPAMPKAYDSPLDVNDHDSDGHSEEGNLKPIPAGAFGSSSK